MTLPPSCNVAIVNPRTSVRLSTANVWASTDMTYSLN